MPLTGLAAAHLPLQRTYWVTLTVAVVLKPDWSTTWDRGVARAAGTAIGVGVAGVLAAASRPSRAELVALVAVLAAGAFTVWQANFAAGVGFVTAIVVLLLDLLAPDTFALAGARLADTVIGAVVALVAYRVWPTWSAAHARTALAALIVAQREYLGVTLAGYGARGVSSGGVSSGEVAAASRAARLARSNAEEVVARSLADPAGHRLDPATATGLLAGSRRVSQAVHALRAGVVPLPEPAAEALGEIGAWVDTTLAGAAASLEGAGLEGAGLEGAGLEEREGSARQDQTVGMDLVAGLADAGGSALLAVEAAELVDAAGTVAGVAARWSPP